MIAIHPKILKSNGKKEFVIITYGEFIKIQEMLEDYDDLKALRAAKSNEKDAKAVSFKDAKKILNLN